ncbi:hypothetical protein QVD17_37551 [Tagetes erecta]|uniref:Uncharacterized protein n=1 Tax=Tagetes erecta TaxID=13708 RepID=A0AAD8JW85_TARER|nr:hypothetical protein QVD17_37551 [Tagetes erecta]
MKVVIRETTMVKPAEETTMIKLWNSILDLSASNNYTKTVYFYRANGAPNFFDTKILKEALSRALVPFYPIGGRFKEGEDGRVVIDCQGQGVLFLVADSDGVIDDFGNFAPTLEYLKLFPVVDNPWETKSNPLAIFQVTYFKCGGVSLGVQLHHRVQDGMSALHFINTWSDMARGKDITLPPFIDRTLLRANNPPRPIFNHIKYQPDPTTRQPLNQNQTTFSTFKLTRDQLHALKAKSTDDGNTINYTSFEILSGHLWKCVCKARSLPDNVDTKLHFTVDGRKRLQPPLPEGYFGNAVFMATAIAPVGEIQTKPTWYAASKIRDATKIMNNDYLRSSIDYMEENNYENAKFSFDYTNVFVTSWSRLPIHDADFGWGRPVFMGRIGIPAVGRCYVLPSPTNDGSLSIIVGLEVEQMKLFSKLWNEVST